MMRAQYADKDEEYPVSDTIKLVSKHVKCISSYIY